MTEKSILKKEYGEARLAVRKIINKIDPINLFPGSAEDEYDPEVGDILVRLNEGNDEIEITRIVKEVFDKWFGEDIEEERLQHVGRHLMKVKNQYSWLRQK